MIYTGDIITTNYCGRWPQTWQVTAVKRDCECGRYSVWPSRLIPGRQRLPHLHITALDERGEKAWWNGMLERDGRLINSGRIWTLGQRIHPEILLVERAEQGSLF